MSVASTDREPNRWAVLALLGVAQLMVVLDATIVTIAIPSAQKALHFSTESPKPLAMLPIHVGGSSAAAARRATSTDLALTSHPLD